METIKETAAAISAAMIFFVIFFGRTLRIGTRPVKSEVQVLIELFWRYPG